MFIRGRLRRITLEVRDGVVARSEQFGHAGVDHGTLILVDLDAAGSWRHSHRHQLMEQLRTSKTESGTIALGDARACGFSTTWGDGLFELHRDLDHDGNLLRMRIELGTEKHQQLSRKVEYRALTRAMVTRSITEDGEPVRFMYREEAMSDEDSGWRMFSGLESDAYANDIANVALVPLTRFDQLDPRVARLLDAPIGSVFERREADADFEPVTDWQPPDD